MRNALSELQRGKHSCESGNKVMLATEGHKIKFLLIKFQRCPNVLK